MLPTLPGKVSGVFYKGNNMSGRKTAIIIFLVCIFASIFAFSLSPTWWHLTFNTTFRNWAAYIIMIGSQFICGHLIAKIK